mgnify:CR=1 FL=1
MAREVEHVAFRLMTPDDIEGISGGKHTICSTALERSKEPLIDGLQSALLGTDSRQLCAICKLPREKCFGHSAPIPLNTYVFHPWLIKLGARMLEKLCYFCASPLSGSGCANAACRALEQPKYISSSDDIRAQFTQKQLAHLSVEQRKDATSFSAERAYKMLFTSQEFHKFRGVVLRSICAVPLLLRPSVRTNSSSSAIARDQLTLGQIEVIRAALRNGRVREVEVKKQVRYLLESVEV